MFSPTGYQEEEVSWSRSKLRYTWEHVRRCTWCLNPECLGKVTVIKALHHTLNLPKIIFYTNYYFHQCFQTNVIRDIPIKCRPPHTHNTSCHLYPYHSMFMFYFTYIPCLPFSHPASVLPSTSIDALLLSLPSLL